MAKAHAKERTKILLGQAADIIAINLGMPDIARLIFSERNIIYCYNDPPALMALSFNKEHYLKINVSNVNKLCIKEITFLLMHECLHYTLKHIQMWPLFRNKHAANMAADLIVNDILQDLILNTAKDNEYFKEFKYKYYFGQPTIGCSTINMTMKDVYTKIMLNESIDKENYSCDHESISANNINEFAENIQNNISGNQDVKELTQEDIETTLNGNKAGNSGFTTGEHLVGEARAIFNFNKIFKKLTGHSLLRGDNEYKNIDMWTRRNRATISLPQDKGVLPGTRLEQTYKKIIHLFIDISGSISKEQCNLFANFNNHIPKTQWEVHVSAFNSMVIPDIELDNKGNITKIKIGGGTSFNAIIKYIDTLKYYPDNIVVITDGECNIGLSTKYPNRWSWIIDNDNLPEDIRKQFFGNIFDFKEITKILQA